MEKSYELIEELNFAKIDGSTNYAFLHSIFPGKLLIIGKSQYKSNFTQNEFIAYLAGACFGKKAENFHLYNGISAKVAEDIFNDLNLTSLQEKELENILLKANISEDIKKDIKNIAEV